MLYSLSFFEKSQHKTKKGHESEPKIVKDKAKNLGLSNRFKHKGNKVDE